MARQPRSQCRGERRRAWSLLQGRGRDLHGALQSGADRPAAGLHRRYGMWRRQLAHPSLWAGPRPNPSRQGHLDDHPLRMVGIDFNEAALEPARRALAAADVPGLLISGDVGDPAGLRSALSREGLDIENGLHIRSFLDHDRTYWGAVTRSSTRPASRAGRTSTLTVCRSTEPMSSATWCFTSRRWSPHLRKHGLVTLEAHCVHPRVARRHLGSLHSVAFDAYHAYSHQYPVEYAAFLWCARRAGLERLGYCERHYPTTRPFVAVSLNRFVTPPNEQELPAWDPRAPREDTWRPKSDVDLEDGERLHELLFEAGDLRRPRLWCSAATGFVVGGTLDVIEERLELATEGDAIRVLDYGTGTGLAAIELLKAVAERGLERRLEERGVSLELHLADLPGPWLAQGYRLLQGCSWTRFHALRDGDGRFRPLLEVTGGQRVDVVMANMVFHLIPPNALERLSAELTNVIAPGGRLLWNSPDLAPAGPFAALFHDPNRALRSFWLACLRDGNSGGKGGVELPRSVEEAVDRARTELDEAGLDGAQLRADRRILPVPHSADEVAGALGAHLEGDVRSPTYEMLDEEILDAILVPSNQGEYLPEITDRSLRETVIRDLMRDEVLPRMEDSGAGTALGLNMQWTLGEHVRL